MYPPVQTLATKVHSENLALRVDYANAKMRFGDGERVDGAGDSSFFNVLAQYWAELVAFLVVVGAGIGGFLNWYKTHRDDGRQFLTDMCELTRFGSDTGSEQVEETPTDHDHLLSKIERLKARDDLDVEQSAKLDLLSKHLVDDTISALFRKAGLDETPLDAKTEADTREAVRETVKEGDAEELRALDMIAEGDLKGGLARLVEHASEPTHTTATHWRRIGRLAYPADTALAIDAYRKVIALDRSDPWDGIYLGRLFERAGDLNAARQVHEEALEHLPGGDQRTRSALFHEIGDIQVAQGDLTGAQKSYGSFHATAKYLVTKDPGNAEWRRDLSVSHNKIGDVQVAQGDLLGALKSYRAGLEIAELLGLQYPGKAEWQRDLSVIHERIGDVQMARGDLLGAQESYRARLKIMERLTEQDPASADWQRELSASHDRIGEVLRAQANLPGALTRYRTGLEIRERLALQDPGNAVWQRDLSVSHEKIGAVLLAQGDLSGALQSYRAGLKIRERLGLQDPGNAGWQRDLSVGHNKIGDVLLAQEDLPGALESYRAGLGIVERLGLQDPGNAEWRRDLSVSHNKIGDVLLAQGDLPGALKSYGAGLEIAERLCLKDPDNAEWQADAAASHGKLGQALKAMGQRDKALAMFRKGRALVAPLAERSEISLWKDYLEGFDAEIAALEE